MFVDRLVSNTKNYLVYKFLKYVLYFLLIDLYLSTLRKVIMWKYIFITN